MQKNQSLILGKNLASFNSNSETFLMRNWLMENVKKTREKTENIHKYCVTSDQTASHWEMSECSHLVLSFLFCYWEKAASRPFRASIDD